jgi:predicted AAA+ superfamily ATPase
VQIMPRRLRISLPKGQSTFLWGPRKTGKTSLLRQQFPQGLVYDFLDTDLVLEFSKRPALLRERLLAKPPAALDQPVILDEVQKVPMLLDEVHWLIENRGMGFVLCGSSARKMRRGYANLLGGRAWRYELFPLVSPEIGEVDLLRLLNHGAIPSHYLATDCRRALDAYVRDYLTEEVYAEGLTRNLPAFARFLDAVGYTHGELVNYANVARDCGVDAKTVREYYQILVDTLLGRRVEPFSRRAGREVIAKAAKFYLFDVGVAGTIVKRTIGEARGEAFGRAFEHFILMELAAHASYSELGYPIRFWRTRHGVEVDFILGDGEVALEVKGSARVENRDCRSLHAFVAEHRPRQALLVCCEREERVVGGVRVVPWRQFLERLWAGDVIG